MGFVYLQIVLKTVDTVSSSQDVAYSDILIIKDHIRFLGRKTYARIS